MSNRQLQAGVNAVKKPKPARNLSHGKTFLYRGTAQ